MKLPENVSPTITDRDFVIATVAPPTILVEPVKTEEATSAGDVPADAAEAAAEGTTQEEEKDKSVKDSDDKGKTPPADKGKSAKPSDDKGKSGTNKETKKK